MRQRRRMANPKDTGANAPPAEEQEDRRFEETEAAEGSYEGVPMDAGAAADVLQEEAVQNTAQGEGTAAAPLKTGTRKRNNT
jgi:hypothetical protein